MSLSLYFILCNTLEMILLTSILVEWTFLLDLVELTYRETAHTP